jgi:hypothetical protein
VAGGSLPAFEEAAVPRFSFGPRRGFEFQNICREKSTAPAAIQIKLALAIQGQYLVTPAAVAPAAFAGGIAAMSFDRKESGTSADGRARSFASSDSISRSGPGSGVGRVS